MLCRSKARRTFLQCCLGLRGGTFLFLLRKNKIKEAIMYEELKMQVIAFEEQDIICDSVFGDEWSDENADQEGWT